MEQISKEIIITSAILVIDIQKQFTLFYPFLKIEFFAKPNAISSLKKHTVNSATSISKLTSLPATVKLNVAEDRTVAQVEQDFREQLGLSIQVFRKSGNVWNAISLTDSWTLESQNKAGEFISTEMSA